MVNQAERRSRLFIIDNRTQFLDEAPQISLPLMRIEDLRPSRRPDAILDDLEEGDFEDDDFEDDDFEDELEDMDTEEFDVLTLVEPTAMRMFVGSATRDHAPKKMDYEVLGVFAPGTGVDQTTPELPADSEEPAPVLLSTPVSPSLLSVSTPALAPAEPDRAPVPVVIMPPRPQPQALSPWSIVIAFVAGLLVAALFWV